jgi:hypothetical protein
MPRAVGYDGFGGIDVLRVEEVARPVPGDELALALGVTTERIDTIGDGHLDVPIANVYPLAQVREAYTELERLHTRGKVVLRP